MVGKATVYNTIQLLKDLGQVLELEFGDTANRYDSNMPESARRDANYRVSQLGISRWAARRCLLICYGG